MKYLKTILEYNSEYNNKEIDREEFINTLVKNRSLEMNYFQILNIEETYSIKIKKVESFLQSDFPQKNKIIDYTFKIENNLIKVVVEINHIEDEWFLLYIRRDDTINKYYKCDGFNGLMYQMGKIL